MVNLSKVDYRARETIKLLNQFRGVATYECCMGHLESRMNGSVTRYIPGLVLEKDRWYLDGKPMLSSEAQRLFSEGATGDNNVHINPISEIYSSNHQSLSRTYSVLRFAAFPRFLIALRKQTRQTNRLSDALEKLYLQHQNSLKLIKAGRMGFSIRGNYLSDNEITRESIDKLVKEQTNIENFWKEIATTCEDILAG